MPRLQQGADDAQHRARAGIAVGLGHIVIDHQDDVALPSTIARAHDVFAVGQMLVRQNSCPRRRPKPSRWNRSILAPQLSPIERHRVEPLRVFPLPMALLSGKT